MLRENFGDHADVNQRLEEADDPANMRRPWTMATVRMVSKLTSVIRAENDQQTT
jgi:hypothetical protein